jgi:hypothetical protein
MHIILLLIAALLGAAPQPATPDADPTTVVFAAVAAEFATMAEGEPRAITVDPRWREPFPTPPPDAVFDLDSYLFGIEPMTMPLRESLSARLPGIEFCEGEPGVTHCIESAENLHLALAPLSFDGERVSVQVVAWSRVTPGRGLTSVEIWDFTLDLDGDRATIVSQERVLRGHGRIRTP